MINLSEQISVDESWKQPNGMYKCPICGKEYIRHGIIIHIYRAHTDRKFSSGNNGKYNDEEYKNKLKTIRKERYIQKVGLYKEFLVKCDKCGKEFSVKERENKFPQKEKYYCSRSCANGRIHSDETKLKIKKSISKYKKPIFNKICQYCEKPFETSDQNKKCCCKKCSFKNRYKHLDKTTLKHYRSQCAFKFALNTFPNEFDFNLIKEYGWYKAKNHGDNLNGISRDHIISVKYGYENSVDPEIISHPANCQLLRHNDNSKKFDKCELTLDDLLIKIDQWNKKYNMGT